METLNILALALGAAWASGINLYAAVLLLGGLGTAGAIDLPADLQILSHPGVLAAAAGLYLVEFVADKVPGVDSAWDGLHSFIRIPAGALLAAGVVAPYGEEYEVVLALLAGGAMAAASHATKAGGRVAINTSPEPFSNWIVSLLEDFLVVGGLILALFKPVWFLTLLAVFILMVLWLLPKLWRALRRLFGGLRRTAGPGRRGFTLNLTPLRDPPGAGLPKARE
ncbi:MAG: DUF4126 domain-containing protein [Alphaproteobacteria bacterium]|nr:DUF4126 domain-containing protein [Alphaproteobacteria bacterium]